MAALAPWFDTVTASTPVVSIPSVRLSVIFMFQQLSEEYLFQIKENLQKTRTNKENDGQQWNVSFVLAFSYFVFGSSLVVPGFPRPVDPYNVNPFFWIRILLVRNKALELEISYRNFVVFPRCFLNVPSCSLNFARFRLDFPGET